MPLKWFDISQKVTVGDRTFFEISRNWILSEIQ